MFNTNTQSHHNTNQSETTVSNGCTFAFLSIASFSAYGLQISGENAVVNAIFANYTSESHTTPTKYKNTTPIANNSCK